VGKKRRVKVVLDTNILISALGWKGNPHRIVEKIASGNIELITCKEQLDELYRVLEYPKFAFSKEQKARFKQLISALCTSTEIPRNLDIVVEDPSDNIIAECALIANADFLVTGDPHLLSLGRVGGKTRIVRAREFLQCWA
jgi:uncharacterized protein